MIRKDFERSADFWVIYDGSSNSQKISMRKCLEFPLRFRGILLGFEKKATYRCIDSYLHTFLAIKRTLFLFTSTLTHPGFLLKRKTKKL